MSFKKLPLLLLIAVFMAACGTKKNVATKKKKSSNRKEQPAVVIDKAEDNLKDVKEELSKPAFKDAVEEYIYDYKDVAMKEMRLYNIPASITLSQGILESGTGKGRLAVEANNHFGIKCHREWTGQRIYHDDDEDQECFRKYKDAKFSYRDHSLFLKDRKRYTDLFKLPRDDYEGWAKGLKKAGYATDRKYPDKLISLIERYELYTYDAIVLGKSTDDAQKITDKQDRHVVSKGDTLYKISKKYDLSIDELKEYNGLIDNNISIGQVLFIKPLTKDF